MMNESALVALERRVRELEDRMAIYQIVCGYGYAVDGLNAEVVGSFYADDGVYDVSDLMVLRGREQVKSITQRPTHQSYVHGGVAHTSTLPHVVIEGDRAVATCHTVIIRHGSEGFHVFRASASRIDLARNAAGQWEIKYRKNLLLNGDPEAHGMLARLKEGPGDGRVAG